MIAVCGGRGSGFRTCSSINGDLGTSANHDHGYGTVSVRPHDRSCSLRATEASVGRHQPAAGTHGEPSKPSITEIKGRNVGTDPTPESSWRHIASQGLVS